MIAIVTNYIDARFVKYISNLIYYNSINFDKKRRVLASRNLLVIDNNENKLDVPSLQDIDNISPNLQDHITNSELFHAYEKLSEQQKKVLSLYFVKQLTDKEISNILGSSQQNISKLRLKALDKLRKFMKEIERR